MVDVLIPDAKADTTYQKTVADLARALTDYQSQQNLARTQYDTSYNDAQRRMGWTPDAADPTKGSWNKSTGTAYGDAMYTNDNDFAGRGTVYSGVYANANANIGNDFADRKTALDTARKNDVDTQAMALQSFKGTQEATQNAALTDAVAKLASKYGIELGEVPQGTTKTVQREAV